MNPSFNLSTKDKFDKAINVFTSFQRIVDSFPMGHQIRHMKLLYEEEKELKIRIKVQAMSLKVQNE